MRNCGCERAWFGPAPHAMGAHAHVVPAVVRSSSCPCREMTAPRWNRQKTKPVRKSARSSLAVAVFSNSFFCPSKFSKSPTAARAVASWLGRHGRQGAGGDLHLLRGARLSRATDGVLPLAAVAHLSAVRADALTKLARRLFRPARAQLAGGPRLWVRGAEAGCGVPPPAT